LFELKRSDRLQNSPARWYFSSSVQIEIMNQ